MLKVNQKGTDELKPKERRNSYEMQLKNKDDNPFCEYFTILIVKPLCSGRAEF